MLGVTVPIFLALVSFNSLAAPFSDDLAQRLQACTACHGEQGRAGPDGYYPRLAGKPSAYLFNQLVHFRDGRRHYGLMTALVDNLSDNYLQEIAEHFSRQDIAYPKPIRSNANQQTLALGQSLALRGDASKKIPACSQCHGARLTGVLPQTPGLLGLPKDYLIAQLGGWKTGQRRAHAPDCMADVAKKLSDTDVSAVAHWLSAQTVPLPSGPAPAPPASAVTAPQLQCGVGPSADRSSSPESLQDPIAERGLYLVRLGGCAACHTARGGMPFAGGKRLETPFGTFFSSNLTPHPSAGIGQWTADNFWRAMHHGESADGRWLYPAFPYTNYTRISRADSDAMFAYLRRLKPSAQLIAPHELAWPYSSQWALGIWRWWYFSPQSTFAPAVPPVDTPQAALLQRGATLVNGLGHCSACHAKRNRLGAVPEPARLNGGSVPGSRWTAPAIPAEPSDSTSAWTVDGLAKYLVQGHSPIGNAKGPMAEVVLGGTQYLTPYDAQAMATYLLASQKPALPVRSQSLGASLQPTRTTSPLGARLYEKHCESCHGADGKGIAGAYPPLQGNRTVISVDPANLVQITTLGGFAPATQVNPRPFGMPPFQLKLSNQELSALLTYIRSAWGNTAAAVSEFDINKLRPHQSP